MCLYVCVSGDTGVVGAVSDIVRYLCLVHEELHLLQGQQPHMEGQRSTFGSWAGQRSVEMPGKV